MLESRTKLRVLVVAMMVIVVGGIFYIVQFGTPSTEPAAAPTPSTSPAPEPADLEEPYRTTSVQAYAQGADGIVTPKAEAVGDFTVLEVSQLLAKTKQFVVLSRIDALERGDTTAFLDALAPSERQRLAGLLSADDLTALSLFSRLAPDAELLDAPVKLAGSMSYKAGKRPGELVVSYKYVFVYPLRPHDPKLVTSQEQLLVSVRDEGGFIYLDDRYPAEDRGGLYAGGRNVAYNIDCPFYQQGLLSLPRDPAADTATTPANRFDPSAPFPTDLAC